MASSPLLQVAASSLDQIGASVVTATRNATDSRLGSLYNTTNLAAGAPVHVHMINPSQYLVAFSQRWTGATPSAKQPGFFSAFTQDTNPSWFITGPSGARTLIDNTPVIPIATSVDSATLQGGASHNSDYIYLLHSVTQGGAVSGLVQHFRVATAGRIVPVGEEVIPNLAAQGVSFDQGVSFSSLKIRVFGTDSDGHVFVAQKPWGAIGAQSFTSAKNGGGSLAWQFNTGTGWDADPANAAPLPGLMSAGPVSTASWRNSNFMSTVVADGSNMAAQIMTRKVGRPWTPMGSTVPLGSTANGTYVGDTLQLQGLLAPTASMVNVPAAETAIPYLTTTKAVSNGEHALQVVWDLLQVPRQT